MLDTIPENQVKTPESSPKVSQDILAALNVTQEDIDRLDQEKIKLQQAEDNGKTAGADFYRPAAANETKRDVKVGNITVQANTPKNEVADFVVKNLQSSGDSISQPKSEAGYHARGFLDGLGNSAILSHDWKTAIASFDTITEGGIVKNERVMNQLTSQDMASKVEIAKIIQERRNASTSAQTPPVEKQTPSAFAGMRPADNQSTLRPVPTNPPPNPSNIY